MPVVIVDRFGLSASFCLAGSFFNTLLMDLHENVTKKEMELGFSLKQLHFGCNLDLRFWQDFILQGQIGHFLP